MRYADKTREQLVSELVGLRQRVAELEASEAERQRADEELVEHRDHLEKLVGERTAELKALNWHLQQQITEREQAEQALGRTSKELQLVNLVNNAANQGYSLPRILQLVVQGTKKMFSCNGATFYEISEDGKYLVMQNLNLSQALVHQIEKLVGRKIPKVRIRLRAGSLYLKALQAGKPQLINDPETIRGLMAECTANKLLKKLVPRIHQLLGIASVMQAPLISEGEVTGLVDISRKRPFTESELERFTTIAQQLLLIIKRKRAEENLQTEKNKLQSVIGALEYGLSIQDRDYNILYQTGQLKKHFGDYLGDKCYRAYERKDTICDDCPVKKAFKDGRSYSAVKKGKTPSGEVFFLERTASPIRNAEGKIVSCLEVTRDVTQRELAEEKLRDATQKWTSLVENTNDIIIVVDDKGAIQYINRAIPPHTVDQVIGRTFYDYATPEYREVVREAVAKVFATGEQVSYESSVEHPSGVLSFETTMIPITEDGKVISAMSFHKNITERKQMEEALRAEKNKLQSVIDAIEYGINIIDTNYNIVYQNEHFRGATGYRLGEKCYQVYEGRDTVCDGCPVEQAFESGKSHTSEKKVVTPSGEVEFWEHAASPIRDTEGRIVSCLELTRNITERKQAEETLRESEEKYKELAESITDIFFAFDGDLKYTYWNKASEELTGISAEDALGKNLYEVFPDNEMTRSAGKVYLKALRTQQAQSFVNEFQVGGKNYFFEVNAYPSKGGLSVFVKDITERKRAEEELREARDKAQKYLDIAGVIIVAIDSEGKATLINRKGSEVLGYKAEEVIGQDWFDLVVPPRIKEDLLAVSRKLLSGEIEPVEFYENPILTKSGEERLIAWHNTVLRDERGDIIGHLSSGEDITERKQAEEAVRESEEKLRKMFESVTDGISVVNLDGIITEVNQRTLEMHGFGSRDEILGKSAFDLVDPADHEKIAANMRKALKEGTVRGVEYTLLRADGTEFPAELGTSMLKDASGKAIGHITISRDITERQQAEEREEELQQELNSASRLAAVGELAAGVAHEMNNPLTGIMGFSERLLRKSGDDDAKKDVEIIHREAQRLAKVVKNLLTFARQREPAKEFADINEIVQKTLELRAYELKSGNIEVALDLAADLPQIMVDFHQIQEVFLNIILNAEQVMTEASGGGKLTIKTRPIKDYVRISFADDGPGIPAEHLDKVFNPFFTTKGEVGGTGLGLSVCHGIVTEHGGRIYARSKPGSGATFLVDLPLTSGKIGESQIAPEKLSV